MISAPATFSYTTEVNVSENNKNGSSNEDKEKEMTRCLSGFIFLCNQSTKLECYRYRVFGLPLGAKEVVKEIKFGFKLFLFDFELKLLYGVYEATSDGILNLEPAAFGGKFPAQVKFKIFKECLPMPESSLRFVIKENYTGSKFKQELSGKQVKKLISSFRPLATSLHQPASQDLANVLRPGAIPPSLVENRLEPTGGLPVREVPGEVQYSHVEARPGLNAYYPEHGSHRRAAYVEDVPPTFSYRSLPISNSYVAHPQQPLRAEDVSNRVQDPSYSSYRTTESGSYHDQVTSFERRFYQLPPLQRQAQYQHNGASYYSNLTATHQYNPSVLQTQPPGASYQQLSLQGRQYQETSITRSSNPADLVQYTTSNYSQQGDAAYLPYYSNSTATLQYTPSVLQTQPPSASYHQLSLQGRQYQDTSVTQSSNPADPVQYTTSNYSQQGNAAYLPLQNEVSHQGNATANNSNLMEIAQYASTVLQSLVPVPYNQSSLHGTQYQDSAVAYSSNLAALAQYPTSISQPQVEAPYIPPSREAFYQENVVPYNSEPTVSAQYIPMPQQEVPTTNWPVQSEALPRVDVASYNYNPLVTTQYTPVGQPEGPPYAISEGRAPVGSYSSYSAADLAIDLGGGWN